MPLYEYQCSKCGHRFEVIQKFSDQPKRKCPRCGGPIEKLLSAPAIQFKGTGWYVTDYGGKKNGGSGRDSDRSQDTSGNDKPREDKPAAPKDKKDKK